MRPSNAPGAFAVSLVLALLLAPTASVEAQSAVYDAAPAGSASSHASGPDAAPQAARQGLDAATLLARADAAYAGLRSLRARFEQTIAVPLLDRERTGHGMWYQKGRGRFFMDFEDPPDDAIVADGIYMWLYYPSTHPGQVTRATLARGTADSGTADLLARILEQAQTGFEGTVTGTEEVSGVRTHLIDLVPTERSQYRRIRVWVGTSDLLVRRFEITEENETFRSVTLSDLEPNAELADTLFEFFPPPGTQVFEG